MSERQMRPDISILFEDKQTRFNIINGIYPQGKAPDPAPTARLRGSAARYLPFVVFTRSVISRKRDATLASFDNKNIGNAMRSDIFILFESSYPRTQTEPYMPTHTQKQHPVNDKMIVFRLNPFPFYRIPNKTAFPGISRWHNGPFVGITAAETVPVLTPEVNRSPFDFLSTLSNI